MKKYSLTYLKGNENHTSKSRSLAFGSTELNRYDFENLEGTSIFL